jgi:hypothetical protein
MDPITGAVVAIVIWVVLISVGWVAFYFVGILIGAAGGSEGSTIVGGIIGYVLGAGWAIFALIQAILQIVHLVQLLGG